MDNTNDTTTTTEYTMPDGRQGVIVRQANGHFAPGTRSHQPISRDNARSLVDKRVAAYRRAAANALAEQGKSIGLGRTSTEVWGALVARTSEQILDSDKPRADALRIVGQAVGAMPLDTDRRGSGDLQAASGVISMDVDTLMRLAHALDADARRRVATDAEAEEENT